MFGLFIRLIFQDRPRIDDIIHDESVMKLNNDAMSTLN